MVLTKEGDMVITHVPKIQSILPSKKEYILQVHADSVKNGIKFYCRVVNIQHNIYSIHEMFGKAVEHNMNLTEI